uniref:DUF642 domain-containing protein n=1 Tax=Oryza brachyantha TaxID=4533 RepID=J3L1T4_ORYBR
MRRVGVLVLFFACAAAHAAAAGTDGIISCFAATCCCFDRLLPNGNFEDGPPKSDLVNGTVVRGANAIPRWETSGFVEYIESGHKQGDMLLVVPQGAHAVRLGNEASIRQRLAVARGAYYAVTFSAARTCAQAERLNVSVSPEWGVLPMQTIYGSSGWDSYAWAFRAKMDEVPYESKGTGGYKRAVLEFPAISNRTRVVFQSTFYHMKTDGTLCGPVIDDASLVGLRKKTAGRRLLQLTRPRATRDITIDLAAQQQHEAELAAAAAQPLPDDDDNLIEHISILLLYIVMRGILFTHTLS